jgi:hypothetical protein
MARTSWLRWIGLALIGAGAGYLRSRARRPANPDDLPVAGDMTMDVGIAPIDPEPMAELDGEGMLTGRARRDPEELR